MALCLHPNARESIIGATCPDCRTSFKGPDSVMVLFRALRSQVRSIGDRVEKAESALCLLGAAPCEVCGTWTGNKGSDFLRIKVDGADLILCPDCLAHALSNEDDELLYDPVVDSYRPGITDALVTWALHRKATDPLRSYVLRMFPEEYAKRRSV